MDAADLRALQAPLKEQYRTRPETARTPLAAVGRAGPAGVTFAVEQAAGRAHAGLHRATGGDGTDACSGDMLLEALLACAGVTLRSVATAMGLDLRVVEGRAEGWFDARGTLGMDRTVPVGVQDVVVTFEVDSDTDDTALQRLGTATERYCVVGATLAHPPQVVVRRA